MATSASLSAPSLDPNGLSQLTYCSRSLFREEWWSESKEILDIPTLRRQKNCRGRGIKNVGNAEHQGEKMPTAVAHLVRHVAHRCPSVLSLPCDCAMSMVSASSTHPQDGVCLHCQLGEVGLTLPQRGNSYRSFTYNTRPSSLSKLEFSSMFFFLSASYSDTLAGAVAIMISINDAHEA